MLLVAVIDRSVPLGYNPHEMRAPGTLDSEGTQDSPGSAANAEASGSRWQAFGWSALSGLSEPLGALLGLLILSGFWSQALLGLSLPAVAGIMIFISFDVLLPAAEAYGEHNPTVYALVAGMAVMAFSLLLL
ncbi:Zinc transporter ZupT [Thiorhodovibrio winogradskyi]|uniref:Zinc transporter ZupT n=1 Tax=Thiorhodovibrio winogradskyi TaxID=77007 RepID=A0ABZ0SFJ1_9GAMM|nr:ZIP family metal transporter [Thiorhodovibrio winogradskyi]